MMHYASFRLFLLSALALVVLAACAPVAAQSPGEPKQNTPESQEEPVANDPATESAAEPNTEPAPSPTAHVSECDDPFAGLNIRFRAHHWPDTNFCMHNVDLEEFLSGGPPPDGIPPIDDPVFESVEAADEWLEDVWPVIFFQWEDDVRAYPLAILMFHEIVNDEVGGRPVTITYCPLCNATIAFNRTLPDGTVLDFGTSGNLRNSDLVMYDRQTFSWWQQFTGKALVGDLTGTQLELLPSQLISWEDFKTGYPDGQVLSRDTGRAANYGRNPYEFYDDINSRPFLFDGQLDERRPAMERVAAIEIGDVAVAYPFSNLNEAKVANDTVAGQALVVFWQGGVASAVNSSNMSEARIVGSTAVFLREADGQTLTFQADEGGFRDQETGSLWTIFGAAIEGPLAGTQLTQVVSAEHFWFSWAAFYPDTLIWEGAE